MNKDEVSLIVKDVDGWLFEPEGRLLYDLAAKCKNAIIEIGTWKGLSTIWLAYGSKSGYNAPVITIDPHTGSSEHKKMYGKVWSLPEFLSNIKKANIEDIVIPIVAKSVDVARMDIKADLVFIDGSHEYEDVKDDYRLWSSKIAAGGVIAFHDAINFIGPLMVVENYLKKSDKFKDIKLVNTLAYATKL